jgi:hypothetical protein
MTQFLKITAHETGEPVLAARLEHVPGAELSFEVIARMDESKLRGPIEEERWVLLEALADQIGLILRHRRSATS